MDSPAYKHVITAIERDSTDYVYDYTRVDGNVTHEELAQILNDKYGENLNLKELISTGHTKTYSYRFSYRLESMSITRTPIDEQSPFYTYMCIKYLLNLGHSFESALNKIYGPNVLTKDEKQQVWEFITDGDFLYKAELLAYNK